MDARHRAGRRHRLTIGLPMRALTDLIRHEPADSSLAFRESIYRRGDQHEMLRDVIALANAGVVGRRFLFVGVDDRHAQRRFPGISERSWKSFCKSKRALKRWMFSSRHGTDEMNYRND